MQAELCAQNHWSYFSIVYEEKSHAQQVTYSLLSSHIFSFIISANKILHISKSKLCSLKHFSCLHPLQLLQVTAFFFFDAPFLYFLWSNLTNVYGTCVYLSQHTVEIKVHWELFLSILSLSLYRIEDNLYF